MRKPTAEHLRKKEALRQARFAYQHRQAVLQDGPKNPAYEIVKRQVLEERTGR